MADRKGIYNQIFLLNKEIYLYFLMALYHEILIFRYKLVRHVAFLFLSEQVDLFLSFDEMVLILVHIHGTCLSKVRFHFHFLVQYRTYVNKSFLNVLLEQSEVECHILMRKPFFCCNEFSVFFGIEHNFFFIFVLLFDTSVKRFKKL